MRILVSLVLFASVLAELLTLKELFFGSMKLLPAILIIAVAIPFSTFVVTVLLAGIAAAIDKKDAN